MPSGLGERRFTTNKMRFTPGTTSFNHRGKIMSLDPNESFKGRSALSASVAPFSPTQKAPVKRPPAAGRKDSLVQLFQKKKGVQRNLSGRFDLAAFTRRKKNNLKCCKCFELLPDLQPFSDPAMEQRFQKIQKETAEKSMPALISLFLGVELIIIAYDNIYSPGPSSVYQLRLGLAMFSFFFKLVLALELRFKPSRFQQKINSRIISLTLVQVVTLVAGQHRRALAIVGLNLDELCLDPAGNNLHEIYCAGRKSDTVLLFCLILYLVTLSYALELVLLTAAGCSIVIVCFVFISLFAGVKVESIEMCFLAMFLFVCLIGAALNEVRRREVFEGAQLSKEVLRRNRKMRASFDRHVANEMALIEHAEFLSNENTQLRAGRSGLESMAESAKSPLLACILELRGIQMEAKQRGQQPLQDSLGKIIQGLQKSNISIADIAPSAKANPSLDAKTQEWLESATSGWEKKRDKDRKNLKTANGTKEPKTKKTNEKEKTSVFDAGQRILSKANFGIDDIDEDDEEDDDDVGGDALVPQGPEELSSPVVEIAPVCDKKQAKAHEMLIHADDWEEFDALAFCPLLPFPLTTLVSHCMDKLHVSQKTDISVSRLINFLRMVDTTYCYGQTLEELEEARLEKRNPYHNNFHAVDVVQSVFCFLVKGEAYQRLSALDRLAILLAAGIHDYHHPGRTNQFLVENFHPIAVQHNDQNPNERYHLSESFKLMQLDNANFLIRLPVEKQLGIRHMIIDLVLATDLANSMEYLSNFQIFITKHSFKKDNKDLDAIQEDSRHSSQYSDTSCSSSESNPYSEDMVLLLQIAIKSADISHPAKPLQRHLAWSELIQEEFFMQGDEQKAMNTRVDPLCDRDNIDMNRAQMGFIDYVCRPLIKPFSDFVEMPSLMINLNKNHKYWKDRAEGKSPPPMLKK